MADMTLGMFYLIAATRICFAAQEAVESIQKYKMSQRQEICVGNSSIRETIIGIGDIKNETMPLDGTIYDKKY